MKNQNRTSWHAPVRKKYELGIDGAFCLKYSLNRKDKRDNLMTNEVKSIDRSREITDDIIDYIHN